MAEYTREQLMAALRKADAAGDVEAARAIARRLRPTAAKPKTAEELTPGLSTNPTEGMSTGQRFAAGAGKSVADTGLGVAQLAYETVGGNPVLGMLNLASNGGVNRLLGREPMGRQIQQYADQVRERDAPLMDTGAGLTGNIAGQIAQLSIPTGNQVTIPGKMLAAAAQGAGFAGIQPVGTEDSRAGNMLAGGALGAVGQGIASGGSRLAQGMVSRLDDTSRGLAQTADDIGMRLSAGELSRNPGVRNIASQLGRLPFSGERARAAANQQAFNRAVGETFGAQADEITPDVFAAAKSALGSQFDDLTARNALVADDALVNQLRSIADEAERLGTADSARMVRGQIDDLLKKVDANGMIPGRAFREFDTALGQRLKGGGDPAFYLGRVRDAVRGAMDNSISPADRQAWRAVRQQYANLKTVEPLVAKAETGDISPALLMGRTTADKAGKARMAAGRGGDLGELARVGQRFLKKAPDSGTADRLAVNLGVLGTVGGAQGIGLITPEQSALAALLLGGNRAALKALSSRGLVQGNTPVVNGLARLVRPAPKVLPTAYAGLAPAFNAGMVTNRRPEDPADPLVGY